MNYQVPAYWASARHRSLGTPEGRPGVALCLCCWPWACSNEVIYWGLPPSPRLTVNSSCLLIGYVCQGARTTQRTKEKSGVGGEKPYLFRLKKAAATRAQAALDGARRSSPRPQPRRVSG